MFLVILFGVLGGSCSLQDVAAQNMMFQHMQFHPGLLPNFNPAFPMQPAASPPPVQPPFAPAQAEPPAESNPPAAAADDDQRVRIDVFYETNCPDSMRFINNQLYPVFQQMKDIIRIYLVPFGKARGNYDPVTEKYDFRCQHGPAECYGNTVQGCALTILPSIDEQMNFINCMESYPRPSSSGAKCANRLGLNWRSISKCAEGIEGKKILFSHGETSSKVSPPMTFVPRIHINQMYTDAIQNRAIRDLKSLVCETYKGQHPMCN